MKHSIAKYYEDIRLSIEDIESYLINISSVKQVEENQMLFDALCRRFAIIGEAVYQADKLNPSIPITDKNKIKSLRHIIVHDYDLVRESDIFLIAINKLPILKSEIETLLKAFDE
ncbi:MAG TPA: DUF86 domain-containing protein [Chitinophagaceae bacterium]|nr:DUF86 domain-containing protein [Chitinophagaceae bacterium]